MDRAAWLMRRDLEELGRDLRAARLAAGLTLLEVADRIGLSESTVLRTERGRPPGLRPEPTARHAAAVGMRARIKAYPDGAPIRDAAQVALIRSFRDRLPDGFRLLLEQPVTGNPADQRAWDALLNLSECRCGLEFVTRFHDCQAQLRSAHLKQRDGAVDRLIMVVKATHANRRAIASVADLIATTFPLDTRRVMGALAHGRDPGANGIAFI